MRDLAFLRQKKGKTQKQMAKILGIGISTYNQYENSQRNIPYGVAKEIADILNVQVEEIFLPVRFTVSKIKTSNEH